MKVNLLIADDEELRAAIKNIAREEIQDWINTKLGMQIKIR